MEQNQLIKIEDESGDRKYFTIIPNYILNHSTAVAQALYLQLKRLGGERGIAYPGRRYLMEKLKISYPTLKKELKYLLKRDWIKENGKKDVQTDGGRQKVQCYKIVDLWHLNNDFYAGSEKIEPPSQRGEKIEPQGVKSGSEKIEPKEDLVNKNHSFKKNSASSFKKLTCVYKPTGEQMRMSQGKWWVLPKDGGEWLLWVDKQNTKVCN